MQMPSWHESCSSYLLHMRNFLTFTLAFYFIFLSPQLSHASVKSSLSHECSVLENLTPEVLERSSKTKWIQVATQATGIVIGAANGVVMTITGGNLQLVAPQLAKWFPLFNEIA